MSQFACGDAPHNILPVQSTGKLHAPIPRLASPRPQFVRPAWQCLNGPWQFEIDHGDSGRVEPLARVRGYG